MVSKCGWAPTAWYSLDSPFTSSISHLLSYGSKPLALSSTPSSPSQQTTSPLASWGKGKSANMNNFNFLTLPANSPFHSPSFLPHLREGAPHPGQGRFSFMSWSSLLPTIRGPLYHTLPTLALSASSSSPRTFLYFAHPKTTLPSDYHPRISFSSRKRAMYVLTAHDSLIHGNLLSASEKHSLYPTEMLMPFIPYHQSDRSL